MRTVRGLADERVRSKGRRLFYANLPTVLGSDCREQSHQVSVLVIDKPHILRTESLDELRLITNFGVNSEYRMFTFRLLGVQKSGYHMFRLQLLRVQINGYYADLRRH